MTYSGGMADRAPRVSSQPPQVCSQYVIAATSSLRRDSAISGRSGRIGTTFDGYSRADNFRTIFLTQRIATPFATPPRTTGAVHHSNAWLRKRGLHHDFQNAAREYAASPGERPAPRLRSPGRPFKTPPSHAATLAGEGATVIRKEHQSKGGTS